MCKVAIIGNAGGGKSTICKKLSEVKGLPLYAVDKLQWKPNWTPAPQEELENGLREITQKDLWIIDGWGPWHLIEERFKEADTIIFVDHSIWIHYWWAFKRQVKALLFPRSLDKPEGCDLAKVTGKMFKMIWMIHTQMRPRLSKLVVAHQKEKDVFHIRSPKELRQFELQHCQ